MSSGRRSATGQRPRALAGVVSGSAMFFVILSLSAGSPHPLFGQCPDGAAPPCRVPAARVATAPPAYSVAVLSFNNLSRDTADAYLADGLTEEITARVAQIARLTVTSRVVARHFRDRPDLPLADLGRALNATYLLSGSVRRGSARLRVTVELVRATSGARLWGEQYDRAAADLLEIEEDIARAVATGIAGRLLPAERASLAVRPTRNPEAYDHYLRGNRLLWSATAESRTVGAIAEYEAALRLDSAFTAARGRLAYAYAQAINWAMRPAGLAAESLLARGRAAADRALREDSTVADAWLGRSFVLFFGGRPEELGAALASCRRAIELNPADEAAHFWLGGLLRRLGRFDEAEQAYHRALAINPERLGALVELAIAAYTRRRIAEARQWIDSGMAVDSSAATTYRLRARMRLVTGDLAGALADAQTSARLAESTDRLRAAASLTEMEARNGQVARARERLTGLLTNFGWPPGGPDAPVSVRNAYEPALAALALGERQLALAILEHARPRGPWLWSFLIWPDFDPLREDPRFIAILEESRPPETLR